MKRMTFGAVMMVVATTAFGSNVKDFGAVGDGVANDTAASLRGDGAGEVRLRG